ncbi:MAG: cell division protein FtsW, partial [Stenotrophomonas sp.]
VVEAHDNAPAEPRMDTATAAAAAAQSSAARGTSRMQQRVEPTFGRIA